METEFSVSISKLRKERGLNQRKAASELEISQALLSHYENGIREPGLDFVVRVCDYYGVSADFVLGRTNIRETVLTKGEQAADSAELIALDRQKQDALIMAAAIFRGILECGDEVAVAALNYMMSSEYRLLSALLLPSDAELITAERRRAEALSEIDIKLNALKISDEMAGDGVKVTSELIRKNVSKTTYKAFETIIAKTEERIGAAVSKAEKK